MGMLDDCEEALVAHWSQLRRLPGNKLHDQDGLVWFELPVSRAFPVRLVLTREKPA
jgi:hypothetical protein